MNIQKFNFFEGILINSTNLLLILFYISFEHKKKNALNYFIICLN